MIKGFRFGMLLQIAVGPVCLFIFQMAVDNGFASALLGVLGVAVIDALYIVLAIRGIGTLLQKKPRTIRIIRYAGAAVLVLFGTSNVLGAFGVTLLPGFRFVFRSSSAFWGALVLTLSNPLTILFWAGVFCSKLAESSMDNAQSYRFSAGAVLSTLVFLSFVAAAGGFTGAFLSEAAIGVCNVIVGAVLVVFGLRTALKAKTAAQSD